VLLRLAYLTVTNTFAVLRLLPMSDRDKDTEILALRHQIAVLERQLGKEKVRFTPSDRVFLVALLHRLPPEVVRRLRLLARPSAREGSMLIRAQGMHTAGVSNGIAHDISPIRTLSQSTRIEGESHVSAPASMSARGRP
jgi:hypothetical protein